MINNKEKILPFLRFKDSRKNDIFYLIQVLQRRKENPDMKKDVYQRGYWFITSLEELEIHWERIVKTCNDYNARAYVNINASSQEMLAKLMQVELSKRILNGDYSAIYKLNYKLGISKNVRDRNFQSKPYWLIDFDSENIEDLEKVKNLIKEHTSIVSELKTLSGYHLIVEAFNYESGLKSYLKRTKSDDKNYEFDEISFSLKFDPNTVLYYGK